MYRKSKNGMHDMSVENDAIYYIGYITSVEYLL